MARKKKSLDDLLSQRDQLDKRIEKERAVERTKQRNIDTRRKAVAGGVILKHCTFDPEFKALIYGLLDKLVERPQDRPLFDLPPKPGTEAPPAPANSTSTQGGNHDRT